jgi:hypothetical protein
MTGASGDKLRDAGRTGIAVPIQWNPALIIVVVPVQDDRDAVLRHQGPDIRHYRFRPFGTDVI